MLNHTWEYHCHVQLKICCIWPCYIICMNMQSSLTWLDWLTYLHVRHGQYSRRYILFAQDYWHDHLAEVGSSVWSVQVSACCSLTLQLDIWGYHLCRRYVSYFTYLHFIKWYLSYLFAIQVLEYTISSTATINTSCDERLDVEKRFPSLVSYFVFRVADNLLMHKIT